MPHTSEHSDAFTPLAAGEAERLADAMGAFTASSRLRLLYALANGERSVEELITATGLSATVVSQQLRVLRQLNGVVVRRQGRRAYYQLYDHHMVALLEAIRHHAEHGVDFGPGAPQPVERTHAA